MDFWFKTRSQTFTIQLLALTTIVSLLVWFASDRPLHGVLAGALLLLLGAINAWMDARSGFVRQSLFQSIMPNEGVAIGRFRRALLVVYWGAIMWLAVWFPDPLWVTALGTAIFAVMFIGIFEFTRRKTA